VGVLGARRSRIWYIVQGQGFRAALTVFYNAGKPLKMVAGCSNIMNTASWSRCVLDLSREQP
jgi:hypothetical protein